MQKHPVFNWPLRSIFWPPTLIAKQLTSVLYFNHLVDWSKFPNWLLKHSFKSLPVAAGSIGMGCIGFPAHPAWEVTSACNLRCIHCHVAGSKPAKDELTTDEARRFIDDLARVDEFRMLVYTGGEPLMRPDLLELLHHSKKAGLTNVIATNGTLITEEVAFRLREAGVVGAAVSLDSSQSAIHQYIRRNDDAFNLAMRGIQALKKAGILLQINVTAMEYNFSGLDELIELADSEGSGIMLMYQLVPVGRGSAIGEAALDIDGNEKLLKFLAGKQKHVSTIIEPVAGPQYWPYLMERGGKSNGIWLKLARQVFHGCAAGRGFVYIKANGDVCPCPFVEINAGNVREASFRKTWRESEVFVNLRNRENTLKGDCGECKYRTICGGCRGRALAYHGDYLAEDPSCFLYPNRPAYRQTGVKCRLRTVV
jgi:radical SAM protein with 4Fe4S-binding SPASM domain